MASAPLGGTCAVPAEVVQDWIPRRQQIFPGEALCLNIFPLLQPELFQGSDLLWFIDNQAAVSATIKIVQRRRCLRDMPHGMFAEFFRLKCRCWFEWIDSDSNPSDGLTKGGIRDVWTCAQGSFFQGFNFPEAARRSQIRSDLLL